MLTRPGVLECMTLLEHRDYRPLTERNELFSMRVIGWSDLEWVVISIPVEEKHLMEIAATECGLRIADGIPATSTEEGIEFFPINSTRAFSLENITGHPVYQNNPDINRAIQEGELESARRIRHTFSQSQQ